MLIGKTGGVERRLSPDEISRVLRRASELAGDGPTPELGLPDAAVIEAAAEVGIPAHAVERAIAWERLGEAPTARRGDRLIGPGVVVVDRALAMPVAEAMARLDEWLVQGHHLRRERWSGRDAEYRRREGLVAAGSRAARAATGEGHLGQVGVLRASAREAGEGTLLRLSVERQGTRRGWAGGGTAVAVTGVAAASVGAVLAAPVLLVATPVAVAAGVGVAAGGRYESDRLTRELGRLLDAVGGRATPSTLRAELTRLVRGR